MRSIQRTQLATGILCDAFAADPVVTWMFPGPVEQRRASAARVFAPLVEASAAAGELAVLDDGAAAVWLPVAAGQDLAAGPEVELPPRLRSLVNALARNHSTERDHLYLAFVGVAQGKQGRGLGGRLLAERLRRADVPVYLEASSARNVPLYERHGFRLTGTTITLPDGPVVWPMWREQEN
ncbi:GNAT family N-acetyltransferase [Allokutzneria albata]|uniref:Acetyltransferase (GNAT) family protein n=1 Tax=Allokutzneria albata TaxID=211114 RepID=A0A1H0DIM3_ALLAB|nr:GNAT family N-acetyltransferase [Allokutzneria albata]SDN69846.1 Acetyltransferase (GNAT) family protein [Allokutzneria albata]